MLYCISYRVKTGDLSMNRYVIGIDVGGTKTAYAVLNEEKAILRQISHPSDAEASPEAFFDTIAANVENLIAECGLSDIAGIGLGMP
jgi:glucokinase